MFASLGDGKLFFETYGRGENLVLLHGWQNDHNVWKSLVPFLYENFQLWLVDLPGFGLSDPPKKPWSLKNYATMLLTFLRKNSITRPILLGHSFGGAIALKFAHLYPDNCKGIILVSSSGIRPKSIKKRLLYLVAKGGKLVFKFPFLKSFQDQFRQQFYRMIKSEDYLKSNELKDTFIKIITEDLTSILPEINTPTLIFWGAKDQETPLNLGKILQSSLPNSKIVIWGNSGHFPFLDKPEDFCQEVQRFITKIKKHS